jgi:hypothetical protein
VIRVSECGQRIRGSKDEGYYPMDFELREGGKRENPMSLHK